MKPARLKTLLFMIIGYLLIAVPFKVLSLIPGFTDVRPVAMLGPVYAVFFGIPGCTVFALLNLVMDALSASLRWSSITGLIANFMGPFIIYLFWTRISRRSFNLRDIKQILKHCGIIMLHAVLMMLIITPAVMLIYPDVDAHLFALSVILNHSAFPILFGIPLTILMQEELGFKPFPLHEKRDCVL